MAQIRSKIKTLFGSEDKKLLRYIAAVCDTKRIESNAIKMKTLLNLLHTYNIKFDILGGATNRIVLQHDGYAVKYAMDEQGYQDNLIEYSLSPELQPYATKTYETNGYISIAKCVEVIKTKEKWAYYKSEILKILDQLAQDYLLGDVGYNSKNMTNWGIQDGHPVILDYAYCHRLNESLFTCGRCGRALTYDSTYDFILCSDRSACKAVYTYNDRKAVQGNKLDLEMIATQKSYSIRLPDDIVSKEITVFDDRMLGENEVLINTPGDYARFLKMKEEQENMQFLADCENDDGGMEDRLTSFIRAAKRMRDTGVVECENLSAPKGKELTPVFTEEYQENYGSDRQYFNGRHYAHTSPAEYLYGENDNDESELEDDDYNGENVFTSIIRAAKKKKAAQENNEVETTTFVDEDREFELPVVGGNFRKTDTPSQERTGSKSSSKNVLESFASKDKGYTKSDSDQRDGVKQRSDNDQKKSRNDKFNGRDKKRFNYNQWQSSNHYGDDDSDMPKLGDIFNLSLKNNTDEQNAGNEEILTSQSELKAQEEKPIEDVENVEGGDDVSNEIVDVEEVQIKETGVTDNG